jgi:hypothetical protein
MVTKFWVYMLSDARLWPVRWRGQCRRLTRFLFFAHHALANRMTWKRVLYGRRVRFAEFFQTLAVKRRKGLPSRKRAAVGWKHAPVGRTPAIVVQ